MALVVADRVRETTTTTGTGTVTLAGAVTGYQSFSAIGNGNTTYYTIAAGSEWEVGIGTYTSSGTTLSRDTVLASSNSGSLVNFSAGTKQVFVTYPSGKSVLQGAVTSSGLTMATDRLLGRDTTGTGAIEELSVGGGLSIGGGQLSVSSTGGILSGTSFPVSPASGDVFRRTDRQIEYYYDGTRWLSTQIFTSGINSVNTDGLSADTNTVFNIPYLPTYDCYLVAWDTTYIRTAAGEWDFILGSLDSAGAVTTIDTQDGSGDASSTWINCSRTLTTLLTSAVTALRIAADEVSGTALIIRAASVQYRLVG